MKIVFAPEARAEFAAAARWYAKEAGAKQARDFKNEVHRILALLTHRPLIGTPFINASRSMPTKRFPYSIVYRHEADFLRVIAVAHQSRRPGYWVERK